MHSHFNKTRIAPTPSGFLHLGNVLSFAITASLAREGGAKILLRIDDLDRARADKKYIQDIFDTLNFLEIPWDEGPRDADEFESVYSQLHGMGRYNEALGQLRDRGLVFACTCSRQQIQNNGPCNCLAHKLPLDTENACWRLITDNDAEISVRGYDGGITRAVQPAEMLNFIVKKKDGFPSYQLVSVIDDIYYGIDLIVRGQDLWPSTLAQQQLASALGLDGFGGIAFYHHPLLKEISGEKLSKSAGATSVHYLRGEGKKPADIYTLAAAMAGSKATVTNWQQLAELAKILLKY